MLYDKYEKQLEETGEKLKVIMSDSSDEVKARLAFMMKEINNFVAESAKEGKQFETTALFAAAIVSAPDLSAEMKQAAKAYMRADYDYVKALAEDPANLSQEEKASES